MVRLAHLQKEADKLSPEDREGLLVYLLHTIPGAPQGPDDEEVMRRDAELESQSATPLTHEEFIAQVRSDRR